MAGKYVTGVARIYGGSDIDTVALLLPMNVNHDSLKRYFLQIDSAGFFYLKDSVVVTYGRSESLSIDSAEGDAALVDKVLNGYHRGQP